MITLPNTPFRPVQIPLEKDNNATVQSVLAKRLALTSPSNISTFISSLEDYVEFIYQEILNTDQVSNYQQVLKFSSGIPLVEGSIPWELYSSKKLGGGDGSYWSLGDEIITVISNIALSYNIRASEIILAALTQSAAIPDSEIQKLWLNSFKLFKKGLEYVNFLKLDVGSLNNSLFETSSSFISFLDSLLQCSIQFTFLSKAIWSLKSVEYDIGLNDSLNYSTLSRISIFVKDELKVMINVLKSNGLSSSGWASFLVSISRLNSAYIGAFLSIENYKQDKMGISLGFLNGSIENIATKNQVNDEDNEGNSKMKKHLSKFKTKLSSNKLVKVKKIKINKTVYEKLQNQTLQQSLTNLFELVDILYLKYNLENNNLNFETITDSSILFQSNLPTGRSVPLSDSSKTWIPLQSVQTSSQDYEGRGQYY